MTSEHLKDPGVQAKAQEARRKAPSRAEKMTDFASSFAEQRQRFPKMALPIIDKAEAGSMPAAVKLMCLDCSGWVRAEVRDCVIPWCPLYPHRPYQRLRAKNPNDVGAKGMTDAMREQIGLPARAGA
jgi:hypothetical protein